jgi:hypothetical protein
VGGTDKPGFSSLSATSNEPNRKRQAECEEVGEELSQSGEGAAYGYVVQYLFGSYKLFAFILLPEEMFQPFTRAKSGVVIQRKERPASGNKIEMVTCD